MTTVQTHDVLVDIEAIRQLKARYCRFLDNKDWAAWRTIFTDDFVSDTSAAGGTIIAGADDFARTWAGPRSRPRIRCTPRRSR